MLLKKSNKIIIHIDCDSFFASCEVLKNPGLKGKFVCVGGEIIVACTYNCKALGIKTGTPIWEARRILSGKKAVFLNGDHQYYEEISAKLFSFLENKVNTLAPFSIDECFCDITGLPEYYNLSLEDYVKKLQSDILKEIGVPVSIGVAETHIKAKIYSKVNKPFGIYIGFDKEKEILLYKKLDIGKIPFIGRKYQEKLKYKAGNIYEFIQLGFWYLKENIGKNATDLWLELVGVNAFVVRKSVDPKSASRSRSFNKHLTNDKEFLKTQMILHFNSLFMQITDKNFEIKHIELFFRTKEFQIFNFNYVFGEYTNDRSLILKNLLNLFENSYSANFLYRSVGVVFSNFRSYLPRQLNLFDKPIRSKDNNYELSKTINSLNQKYGDLKISFGTTLVQKTDSARLGFRV